jgi:hypothetical protein
MLLILLTEFSVMDVGMFCGTQRIAGTDDTTRRRFRPSQRRLYWMAQDERAQRIAGQRLCQELELSSRIFDLGEDDGRSPSVGCEFGIKFRPVTSCSFAADISTGRHVPVIAPCAAGRAGFAVLAPLQKAPQPLYSRQTIRYAAGRVVIRHGAGAGRR